MSAPVSEIMDTLSYNMKNQKDGKKLADSRD
jgi:hypothetical protein